MYTKYFGTEAAQATPLRITMDESIARAEANVTHQREAYQTMKKAERRETAGRNPPLSSRESAREH